MTAKATAQQQLKEKLGELTDQQKLLLIAVSAAIVATGYGLLVLKPQQSKYNKLTTELRNVHETVEQQRQQVAEIPTLKRKVEVGTVRTSLLAKALPERISIGTLRREINEAAAENGAFVTQLGFSPGVSTVQSVTAVDIALQLNGPTSGVLRTLNALEQLQRFTTANELSLQSSGSTLQGSLKMTVYIRNPNAVTPEGQSTQPNGSNSSETPEEGAVR